MINNFKWIPIEHKLPSLGECLICTVYDHIHNQLELRYPVYYMQNPDRPGYAFYLGDISNRLLPDVSEVRAWTPIPEVYDEEIN